ncbi:MAG TPA: signal peptidase I [Thermoanaerobacterales bacterium]|nr:signal peptidase I [Thermoanaerobacterales bacterium]
MVEHNHNTETKEWIQAIIIAVILALLIRNFVVEVFQVDGESMFATLHDGDRLAVNKFIYKIRTPRKGEIIVFKYPSNPKYDYIKRVIAVEGDVVEIKDGIVFVNDVALNEEYILCNTNGSFGPEKIPKNHLFVLGDNRNNSRDSRFPSVGHIPLANVKGKAICIIWPLGRLGVVN